MKFENKLLKEEIIIIIAITFFIILIISIKIDLIVIIIILNNISKDIRIFSVIVYLNFIINNNIDNN